FAHFGYRGTVIHTGAMLGTIMAFNVWFRIWPAQQKIITAVKDGTAPDPALVASAGLRLGRDAYVSARVLWGVVNAHTTWASSWWFVMPLFVLFAWWIAGMMYRRAPKVKGF